MGAILARALKTPRKCMLRKPALQRPNRNPLCNKYSGGLHIGPFPPRYAIRAKPAKAGSAKRRSPPIVIALKLPHPVICPVLGMPGC